MKKFLPLLLVVFLILGFIVRLYRLNNPIADWHEWRQADTSAVSRNFVTQGFDLLHPKFDDLSNVPSGLDNPNGYRFVEFPIYNVAQAGLFKIFGILTLEEWGRIVSIFASLSSAVFIYLLVKKYNSEVSALIATFFFLFIPYSIYYSRTILPDPSMVAATLGGIYFFSNFITSKDRNRKIIYFVISLIFTASAILLKPYAIIFSLPFIALTFNEYKISFFRKWYLWVFLILAILPFAAWRLWMSHYPEGIPASAWLFNEGNIRFKGAFFYWIFADRLGRLISGYWGLVALASGFLYKLKNDSAIFFYSFLISSLAYVTVIARGNVQHDYYQILIIPTVAIFMGLGGEYLLLKVRDSSFKFAGPIIFLVVSFFTLFFGWYYVRDYFNINNSSIVTAGVIIDQMTPKDSKIIANYGGDTAFLYQTKRKGWASLEKDMPEMVKMGADYLALVNPTQSDFAFSKNYKIVYSSDKLLLYDLHQNP